MECREISSSVHFAVELVLKLLRGHGALEGLLVFVEDRVGRESVLVSLSSVSYHPVYAEDNEDGEPEFQEQRRRDDKDNGDAESNAVLFNQLE